MVVRIELDNIKAIIDKTQDAKVDARQAKNKANDNVQNYIRNKYGIGNDLDEIENLTLKLWNDLKDMESILKDYKNDAKIVMRVDVKSVLDEGLETIAEGFKMLLESQIIGIILAVEGAIALLELVDDIKDAIVDWVDEHQLLFEIIGDIVAIALLVAAIVVTGGCALMLIGAGIAIFHKMIELSYDVEAIFITDEQEREAMMNRGAVDAYVDVLGDKWGYRAYLTMSVVSTACMVAAGNVNSNFGGYSGGTIKTMINGTPNYIKMSTLKSVIGTYKLSSSVLSDIVFKEQVSIKNMVEVVCGAFPDSELLSAIDEAYGAMMPVTVTGVDIVEHATDTDIFTDEIKFTE